MTLADPYILTSIWAIVILISVMAFKSLGASYLKPNALGAISAFYLLFAYLGYPILFFKLSDGYYMLGVSDVSIMGKAFLLATLSIVFMIVGAWIGTYGKKHDSRTSLNICEDMKPLNGSALLWTLVAISFAAVILKIYMDALPESPIMMALKREADKAALSAARSAASNDFAGKLHRYAFVMKDLASVATMALFANALIKRTLYSCLLWCGAFLVAALGAASHLSKGPLVNLMLMHILAYVWVMRKRINVKMAMICTGGLFGSIIMMYKYFMARHHIPVWDILGMIASRVLAGQVVPGYLYAKLYPDMLPHVGTSVLPNPGGLLPIENVPFTVHIHEYLKGDIVHDVVGSAPTAFWGEAWISASYAGVVIVSLLVGVLMGMMQKFQDRYPIRSVAQLSLWVYLVFFIKRICGTGATTLLVFTNPFFILLMIWIYMLHRMEMKASHGHVVVCEEEC